MICVQIVHHGCSLVISVTSDTAFWNEVRPNPIVSLWKLICIKRLVKRK